VSLEEILAELVELRRVVAAQAERIAELERRVSADSSNSSRPPSSDAPWEKRPAKKRSSWGHSTRKPGKQPGQSSSSRSLVDDPNPDCGDRTGAVRAMRIAAG
jgi:transposase